MRIGSRPVSISGQTQEYIRAQARPEDFGSGIATALSGLSRSLTTAAEINIDIINAEREREERTRRAGLDLEIIKIEGETRRRVLESRVNVQPGASGYTNATYQDLGATFEDFATRTGLTPEERAIYAPRWEQFVQTETTQAFTFEVEESNRALIDQFSQTVDQVRGEVLNNSYAFEERWMALESAINKSDLPPTVREELLQNSYNSIASVLYQSLTEDALATTTLQEGRPLSQGEIDTPSPFPRAALPIAGNMSSNPRVYNAVSTAWAQVMPPGSRIEVTSSARPEGRTSSQHYHGNAIDFAVYRPDGSRVMWNDPEALEAAKVGRTLGVGGFGWGPTYMGGQTFHWDLRENFMTWSDDDKGPNDSGPGARQFHEMLSGIIPGNPEDLSVIAQQRPDIWTDPRFSSIPFEERFRLERSAEQSVINRQQAAMQASRDREAALMNQIRTLTAFGSTDEAYEIGITALNSGQISDIRNIERIVGLGEESREQQALVGVQTQRRQSGVPAIPSDMPALMVEAQRSGVVSGLQSMDPQASASVLANAQIDSIIPTNVMETLFAQLNSGNQQQQIFSAELLADLYAANPRTATAGLSREQINDVALANTLARVSTTPGEFIDRLNTLRDPTNSQMRIARAQEADELLKDITLPQFVKQMYGNFERFFGGIEMPAPGELPNFEQDARTLFREFYSILGDSKQAQQAAADVLRHSYTPSPLSGQLMQYSPTAPIMNVPTLNNSHSWITRHVEEFTTTELQRMIDRNVELAVASGMNEDEARDLLENDYGSRFDIGTMRIQADSRTLEDLQRFGVPSYTITYIDQSGMMRLLRDTDNNLIRIPMTPPDDYIVARNIGALTINAQTLVDRAWGIELNQILSAAASPLTNLFAGEASQTNMMSPSTAAEIAGNRLYDNLSQYDTRALVLTRDQILARTNETDPFGMQTPAAQITTPSRAEQRVIEAINRIIAERAEQ